MTVLCSAAVTAGTRGISSPRLLFGQKKRQQQDGDQPSQLSAKTLKAEMMPAGKRLMSALKSTAPCSDKEVFVFS